MSRTLLPPGEATTVAARQALVLAPHYDDEVLGCGGLLARLAAAGTRVAVLFLTDGAARPPAGETGEAYAARRREESGQALAVLGAEDGGHLGLPDGALAAHLDTAERGIAEALRELAPDLVLVPSPLEVTADHRAAFAALHGVLGRVRNRVGEGGEGAASDPDPDPGLTVLVYEVNHPGYPNLLVDVGGELDTLERAMACYASQQERHDYLAAGLGLRRFRTLSLPPEVRAAEGYRRLGLADFTTRSPAQLVRHLGGQPDLAMIERGPLVSVVVRTRDRPGFLHQALTSLAEGAYRRVEVVLVNDGGEPPAVAAGYPFPVRRVELAENRGRAAAANAGVAAATGEWIAFLDDDDLAAPEHLAVLVAAASAAGVRVAYTDAAVVTYALGEEETPGEGGGWTEVARRLPYSRDFDPDLLVLDNYIPFNTVLMEAALIGELAAAGGRDQLFDPELEIFEDWDFLVRLARRAPFHHLPRVTCEYRHFEGAAHHALGARPRERRDFLAAKARVLARHQELLDPERLARAVDVLRAEAVAHGEAAAHARREAGEARERLAGLEDRYHRAHGEVVALRAERARLEADLERRDQERRETADELHRLYRDEVELRAAVDGQTEHIGKLYAEIERLNGTIADLAGASLKGIVRWWRQQRRSQGWSVSRIALLSSEPLGARVAGIGLRYLELARRLPEHGIEVVVLSPADPKDTPLPPEVVRPFTAGRLRETLADCQGAVAQGQLANDLLMECPGLPTAIDLYDPWLIENLHYVDELGLAPYRNDHATWVLQLSRGDFFLCSSEEQRLYYAGFLTALGRVNPLRLADDPDLEGLIAPVPFGVPDPVPPYRPLLPPRAEGERRLLFGALYDWYDPWTLLDALARLPEQPWELLFIRHPRPGSTPQRLLTEVERRCRERGWWGGRVRALDWVDAERRYDLLRDVDLLVAPHRPGLETRLSLRTRFLDALAAGCPVVTSEGGALARLLAAYQAGWVAPPEDPAALAAVLTDAVERPDRFAAGARALARELSWDRVLAPLVAFCRAPRTDPTKDAFAFRPPTITPDEAPVERLRRKVGRRLRAWRRGEA